MAHYSTHAERIPRELIDRHPENPRLSMYGDTVASFAQRIKDHAGVYPPEAPVRVRRIPGDRYQMIDGHHRLDGAESAGLDYVLAFVAEMSDEEAREELLLCNLQHGITPLELGLHVLRIESAQGRRGQGLDALAAKLQVQPARLRRYRHAGRAFTAGREGLSQDELETCRKRVEALAEIAIRAPAERWADLVRRCALESWTAKNAKESIAALQGTDGSGPPPVNPAPRPERPERPAQRKRHPKGATNGRSRNISFRIPHEMEKDIKRLAVAHDLPYQTLFKKACMAGLPHVVGELEARTRKG